MSRDLPNSKDTELLQRARKVVPNGVWGHMATRGIGPGYPQFFSRSEGCRVWDAERSWSRAAPIMARCPGARLRPSA